MLEAANEAEHTDRMKQKVSNVLIFQASQALVAIVFALFISDFRRKKDMVALVKEKWTFILKLSCQPPAWHLRLCAFNPAMGFAANSFRLGLDAAEHAYRFKG